MAAISRLIRPMYYYRSTTGPIRWPYGTKPRIWSVSNQALVGRVGVGRPPALLVDSLLRPQPVAPLAPRPVFARLVSDAERLCQQLARHDRQVAATAEAKAAEAAARAHPAITPRQAGYPVPFLAPDQQPNAQRERLKQRLLAEYNALARAAFLPAFLRQAMTKQLALPPPAAKLTAGGRDCFMPTSFWHSQAPNWTNCANTVYGMLEAYYGKQYRQPTAWYDLVVEHRNATWSHGYHTRDFYTAAPNQVRTGQGLAKLDEYMAAHKPVMVGVSHAVNFFLTTKNKQGKEISWHEINGGTIDHFIALVGTGVDKKGRYYRFFDVGTKHPNKGTSYLNKLYLQNNGTYVGTSQATGREYVLVQVRF